MKSRDRLVERDQISLDLKSLQRNERFSLLYWCIVCSRIAFYSIAGELGSWAVQQAFTSLGFFSQGIPFIKLKGRHMGEPNVISQAESCPVSQPDAHSPVLPDGVQCRCRDDVVPREPSRSCLLRLLGLLAQSSRLTLRNLHALLYESLR